jgi:glycine cleavage system transcriptional repressor
MNVIITAIGAKDRPGIIAGLTKAVYEAGGNLDDATMTRLRGAFANMLSATLPDRDALTRVTELLGEIAPALGIRYTVYEMPDENEDDEEVADHMISVYGADRPGLVHGVSQALSEGGANILALDNRMAGDADHPIYVMLLETSGGDWSALPDKLNAASRELGVDISVREIDSEAL